MNLTQRLSKLKKQAPAGAASLSDLEPMTQDEHRAKAATSLRRHMKAQGYTDAEVDAYLAEHQPSDQAAAA